MTIPHRCHAIGCTTAVPREMLMCRKHWFSVPAALRARVWATYRAGQCDDLTISGAYAEAAKAAVVAVAQREGRTVTWREPELLLYERFVVGGGT